MMLDLTLNTLVDCKIDFLINGIDANDPDAEEDTFVDEVRSLIDSR